MWVDTPHIVDEDYTTMARSSDPTSVAAIGERLKWTRLALGNTQVEMARLIGSATNGQAWENYEAGRRRISIDHASPLCRKCRLSLDWIYHGEMDKLPDDVRAAIEQVMKRGDPRQSSGSSSRLKSAKQ
jgi:transcriptional regulator with XRE-family HTH domain